MATETQTDLWSPTNYVLLFQPTVRVSLNRYRNQLANFAEDELLDGTQRSLKYESPHDKYVSSLQRWLSGNSCIARAETRFLKNSDALLSLCPREDGIVAWLERNVCDKVVRRFGNVSRITVPYAEGPKLIRLRSLRMFPAILMFRYSLVPRR